VGSTERPPWEAPPCFARRCFPRRKQVLRAKHVRGTPPRAKHLLPCQVRRRGRYGVCREASFVPSVRSTEGTAHGTFFVGACKCFVSRVFMHFNFLKFYNLPTFTMSPAKSSTYGNQYFYLSSSKRVRVGFIDLSKSRGYKNLIFYLFIFLIMRVSFLETPSNLLLWSAFVGPLFPYTLRSRVKKEG